MKKVVLYLSLALLVLLAAGGIVVWQSVRHVQLPHGAVLHVLPSLWGDRERGAVVICPGGGYSYLETWYEGYSWFPFFYLHGYAPAMLEYRMPQQDYRRPMTDAIEAIAMMRQQAREWHYDGDHIGIVGFSAGGHLASTLLVADDAPVRPDFGILFYPVISMKRELTHLDSHHQLLGEDASRALEEQFSNELHVTAATPPTFLAVARDDGAVTPRNSILFYEQMRAKHRPAALHVYPSGGHGWAVRLTSEYRGAVLDDLSAWLESGMGEQAAPVEMSKKIW